MHAYAPSKVAPPTLYTKWTWVDRLGVSWDDLGGIALEDLSLLAELLGVLHEAQALKGRVAQGGQR